MNSLRFFHVTEGLSPDIMHDILEGCLQYETKELLKQYILCQKIFSLVELNRRIENFPYCYCDMKNKPVPIRNLLTSDNSLKQTGKHKFVVGVY